MTEGLKAFLSGGFGGCCCVVVGHPLDLIKTRLQTSTEYKGMLDCGVRTFRADGIRGLYRGMATPLVGQPPMWATYFWGFEVGKQIAHQLEGSKYGEDQLSQKGVLFAGGFSALPGTLIMTPTERIKVLLQVQGIKGGPAKYNGAMDCTRQVLKNEGLFGGLYKGFGATLLRDGPGCVAYYGAYEFFGRALTPTGPDGKAQPKSNLAILTAGGLAGMAMWIIAVPPDVIKSRIQSNPELYPGGIPQVAKEVLQKDGLLGLYKGIGPALARAFPANAAAFYGMEMSKAFLTSWGL
eukprot:Hpha_TRINITY_DN15721_c3_g6::TRINITY_DN15721_c3_g6_i1::g.39485::m.39485/K15109/SLC25A20_29, CACT, CACL, CRC1; solute carrier family 25 (mitochondrial carnitine/acylcarnitine transporter), member 20/29